MFLEARNSKTRRGRKASDADLESVGNFLRCLITFLVKQVVAVESEACLNRCSFLSELPPTLLASIFETRLGTVAIETDLELGAKVLRDVSVFVKFSRSAAQIWEFQMRLVRCDFST